jgi:hypothetical protein
MAVIDNFEENAASIFTVGRRFFVNLGNHFRDNTIS